MILGLGVLAFTLLHVVLSLVGIVAGLVVVGGLLSGRLLKGWTGAFLVTTVLTNLSGFAFPLVRFLPSHGVGIVSLLLLPVVIVALYGKGLAGRWRTVFALGAVAALYFNVFVLVAQLFLRVPALRALAPTQSEPPFLVTQVLVLALFVILGRAALRGFAVRFDAFGQQRVAPLLDGAGPQGRASTFAHPKPSEVFS